MRMAQNSDHKDSEWKAATTAFQIYSSNVPQSGYIYVMSGQGKIQEGGARAVSPPPRIIDVCNCTSLGFFLPNFIFYH